MIQEQQVGLAIVAIALDRHYQLDTRLLMLGSNVLLPSQMLCKILPVWQASQCRERCIQITPFFYYYYH